MIKTHPGIEVTQENKLFLTEGSPDDSMKVLIEVILCLRCREQCGVYVLTTVMGISEEWGKREGQQTLRTFITYFHTLQHCVLHCKSYSLFSGVIQTLPSPEEGVVLLC